MPNELFVAKRLWEAGDRRAGYEHLEATLAHAVVGAPFEDADFLLRGSASEVFDASVVNLLTATLPNSARTILRAPFARTIAALWSLDPWQGWIDALITYDFGAVPRASGFDDEAHAPPANHAEDFEALAQALADSARCGTLSDDPSERPNGGRAVLPLDALDALEMTRRDRCQGSLRAALAHAFADAPRAPWESMLARDPAGVALRFLHDLVGRYRAPMRSADHRWGAMRAQRPAYAAAAVTALERTLDARDDAWLDEVLAIDVGRTGGGGRAWLSTLVAGLRAGDLSRVPEVRP